MATLRCLTTKDLLLQLFTNFQIFVDNRLSSAGIVVAAAAVPIVFGRLEATGSGEAFGKWIDSREYHRYGNGSKHNNKLLPQALS